MDDAVGCFPPTGALHPPFSQAQVPRVFLQGKFGRLALHVPGQSPKVGDPSSRHPETEQGDNHKLPSTPPAPRAGIWGIHRFWDYGHLGLM